MRNLNDIRTEIEDATARRTDLWRILSEEGHNSDVATELEELNARIDELWNEHRQTRATLLHGDRDRIIQRARAEERLNRAA
jgi:outer membrane murein-binding lipoprotein Lpp